MPTEGIIKPKISIKVVGVGGGGGNILSNVRENYDLDMMLISINSDLRQLNTLSKQGITVLPIGERLTQGRGTGGRVEIGERCWMERILSLLRRRWAADSEQGRHLSWQRSHTIWGSSPSAW